MTYDSAFGKLRPVLAATGLGLGVADVADPSARPGGPAEEAAAAPMPPRRRREFLAGRLAARRALRAVGLDCGDIARAGRVPVFPPGHAASISHSEGIAVAVARVPACPGPVGCDLELRPLPDGAARLVLREDEEAWLRGAGTELLRAEGQGAAWPLTALFSAKEAAWKALCAVPPTPSTAPGPTAGGLNGLRDLRAVPDPGGFRVAPRTGAAPPVLVRVVPVGTGVLSYVTGWADDGPPPT